MVNQPTNPILQTAPASLVDSVSRHFAQLTQFLRAAPRTFPATALYLWREQRHWLILLIPFLFLLFRPLRLVWGIWFSPESPLLFQAFIPFLAAYLAWEHRYEFMAVYEQFCRMWPPESKKRFGHPWLAATGCVLLILAGIALIPSVAILGLLLTFVGTIYYIYGWFVVRQLWKPLVLLILMIPIPPVVFSKVFSLLQISMASLVGILLKPAIPQVTVQGTLITLKHSQLAISPSLSGMGIILPVIAFTLWLALRFRVQLYNFLILLVIAFTLSLLSNLVRLLVLSFAVNSNPALGKTLMEIGVWSFVLIVLVVMRIVVPFFRPRYLTTLSGGGNPVNHAPVRLASFRFLTILFTVTAVLVLLIGFRLSQRGKWLPSAPPKIGQVWEGSEKPLSRAALGQLGSPPTRGYAYTNLFDETVDVHIIAPTNFEAFQEPRIVMASYGYGLSAQKSLPFFGADGPVRAMVFRSGTSSRILMYYWVQYRNGKTDIGDTVLSNNDFFPRFRLGASALLYGSNSCIVRAFTPISQADIDGLQARRNMEQVCQGIHQSLKQAGKQE